MNYIKCIFQPPKGDVPPPILGVVHPLFFLTEIGYFVRSNHGVKTELSRRVYSVQGA